MKKVRPLYLESSIGSSFSMLLVQHQSAHLATPLNRKFLKCFPWDTSGLHKASGLHNAKPSQEQRGGRSTAMNLLLDMKSATVKLATCNIELVYQLNQPWWTDPPWRFQEPWFPEAFFPNPPRPKTPRRLPRPKSIRGKTEPRDPPKHCTIATIKKIYIIYNVV